ncbi:amidase domain-containing protein [Actinomycetota bacterium Odt1-20B]
MRATLLSRPVAALGLTSVLLLGGSAIPASAATVERPTAPASAVQTGVEENWRQSALAYADAHWDWTAWNDSTPVADGDFQPKFQCAEFVARALAAGGLVPGLAPDDPQDAYYHYRAPNGKEYNLLLISDVRGYLSIHDFLMDFGLGKDLGDVPEQAQPGDLVVTHAPGYTNKLHTGMVAQAALDGEEPLVIAHNKARYRHGYHHFGVAGPASVIRIEPRVATRMKAVQQPAANPLLTRTHADPSAAL